MVEDPTEETRKDIKAIRYMINEINENLKTIIEDVECIYVELENIKEMYDRSY